MSFIKRVVRSVGIKVYNCLFRARKIVNNKIVFVTFSNRYDCNPKYICEEFLKEKLPYDLVFATSKHIDSQGMFPEGVRVVNKGTAQFYKELYSAKVIIDNDVTLAFLGFKKKKGQILFQTFHGSIGIKAFGRDANDDKVWHKKADESAKMTDYIISNSKFENNIYRTTFWQNNNILEYGHARNDILFKPELSAKIKEKICKLYGLEKDAKICLYAPTFRDENNSEVFSMNFDALKNKLSEKFGGKWAIFVRFHAVTNRAENHKICGDFIDVSDYPDIQEIAAIIDCGITDYSSWICEYLLRRKPGFIYALDSEHYQKKERPLTIPLEDLPFPLAKSMDELCEKIQNFDEKQYKTYCDVFLMKHGSFDDGHASERIVKKIKEILK